MKHTQEPWALETVDTSIGICHKIGPFPSKGVHGETHACVYNDNVRVSDPGHSWIGDELYANAQRIVTCVNALAGIQNPAAIPEVVEALKAICQYGSDTLSGRADGGLDDREWQRDAVIEMTKRARTALAKLEGTDQ